MMRRKFLLLFRKRVVVEAAYAPIVPPIPPGEAVHPVGKTASFPGPAGSGIAFSGPVRKTASFPGPAGSVAAAEGPASKTVSSSDPNSVSVSVPV